MPITVRVATANDYSALLPLAAEVQGLHVDAHPQIFRRTEIALPRAYFDELTEADDGAIFVAEVDGAVAGYALLRLWPAPPFEAAVPRIAAGIEDIVVARARHSNGIGRALVEAAIGWGKQHDADSLDLTVWEFNQEAIGFYEHLGLVAMNRTMTLTLD